MTIGRYERYRLRIYPLCYLFQSVASTPPSARAFPINKITNIIGVMKAFPPAVGDGPFPTEMDYKKPTALEATEIISTTNTGRGRARARRLGWPNLTGKVRRHH